MTMLNLSPERSLDIDKLIYVNARRLYKDACLLAEQKKSYSSATSLLILSSEEVIKAFLVFLHSHNFAVYKIKNAKKFFTSHKTRHNIAMFVEISSGFLESVLQYGNSNQRKVINTNRAFFDNIFNGVLELANAAKPLKDSIIRIKQLDEFDVLKNMGFYVDYKDKLLVPNDCVSMLNFETTKDIVDRIFRTYKGFRILFHPVAANHISQQDIDKVKEMLKELIDNGLEDYRFDEL